MRKSGIALGIALCLLSGSAFSQSSSLKMGNYIIPSVFATALEEGMTIPVYLRYNLSNQSVLEEQSRNKIADALVVLKDNKITINSVTPTLDEGDAQVASINKQLLQSLNELKDKPFDQNNKIVLSSDATLNFDLSTFIMSLDVNEAGLATQIKARSEMLGKSTVDNISSVTTYDLGVYNNQMKQQKDNTNSYFSIDSIWSFAENHLNLSATAYGLGTAEQSFDFYRAMFERDFNGRRFAFGLLNTWNLQSIASMSALNSSKVYGVTYGNNSSSKVSHSQLSLTPITVFLPSAGEVRLYRDGKLLSIQNFPMGSFEVDTAPLPFGIYEVDIEVVIDGKVRSQQRQTVNKSYNMKGATLNQFRWELYSGYVDYKKRIKNNNNEYRTTSGDNTVLVGGAGAITLGVFSGLNLQGSAYAFDNLVVLETNSNLQLTDTLSTSWQALIAKDGSNRNIFTANYSLPKGIGALWVNREKGNIKDDFPMYDSDSYSFGTTLNFSQFWEYAGSFTYSHTKDLRDKNKSNSFEYATTLYTGRYGSMSLRTGVQRYHYDNQNSTNEKYITLDFSLPLATWLSAGVSSSNGNMRGELSASKSFEDSAIRNAGLSVSTLLHDKDGTDSDFSVSGYGSFDTKYSTGTLTMSRPNNDRLNTTLTARGSLAYSDMNFSASGKQETSGVIVKTGIDGEGQIAANVNGQRFVLSGGNNFIPLSPYAEYKVELLNDKNSEDSFDIASGRVKNVVLYPGNVAVHQPELKQMVTVFGRMKSPDGTLLASAQVRNHIGRTQTDHQGQFAMDVDKRYPVISLQQDDKQICEAELDLSSARGVLWVGDVICDPQTTLVNRN
ncbi:MULTISPECIES: CS1-pili formation C-terminal domain-containing protein [Proteus]|uniref:CS1-pili formation C-terminal domain-containing protein n=1 Tax=Proteus TaxID=583 RepID=UPI000D69EE28|nr:CS1-pili formation C-terminal domain-containing protein [Proteus terrae]MBG5951267.1 CS1-pili formation C-terminal domain-containing protein [Proteus terrae]MCE9840002.1 CS1-pili formation C-terminal domain-containing protein [Proteus terrae]MCT8265108.1 CS1-pili formation C-terminal domain-containing protein [Proteus terrae]NBN71239.1 fimbrial biogenesis outer membrane usher protein [Proteus sp. G2618]